MATKAKAKAKETTGMTRAILTSDQKPAHLTNSRGRTRKATEFDDQVKDWYEANDWRGVPVDSDEELDSVYNDVKKAADLHGLGLDRVKDDGSVSGQKAVWVFIRDPQHRGPRVGSKKDPRTGKMVQPDTEEFEELQQYLASQAS